jgi:hypothetical protein
MSRSLYFVGGLAAMLLVVFTQYFVSAPPPAAEVTAGVAADSSARDSATVAFDDLAAWPAAAGR